jgi:hypothetical protein
VNCNPQSTGAVGACERPVGGHPRGIGARGFFSVSETTHHGESFFRKMSQTAVLLSTQQCTSALGWIVMICSVE